MKSVIDNIRRWWNNDPYFFEKLTEHSNNGAPPWTEFLFLFNYAKEQNVQGFRVGWCTWEYPDGVTYSHWEWVLDD